MQELNEMVWSYNDFTIQQDKPQTIERQQKEEVSKEKYELIYIMPSKTKVISLNKKKVA